MPKLKQNARCPSCGKNVQPIIRGLYDTRYGIKNRYNVGLCGGCGLEATLPVPSQEELNRLYAEHYNFSGERGTVYTGMRERFLFSSIYKLWLLLDGDISFHARKGTGRLIDIGCNEGRGLKMCAANGWDAEGLELNENAASLARWKGFRVHIGTIEDFSPKKPYDVAVLSNVLEHSRTPREMLSHVKRVLKPGGRVWISCPNSRSWQRTLFGRRWINWHVPFHITHFSKDTLRRLLKSSGFRVVEVKHRTPALWVAQSLISALFARRGRATRELRNPFIVAALTLAARGLLFPVLWIGNVVGRGDCLVVTAEKC